ncbi:MAG: GNAT family N-acetyltransferase [Dokdonella sp.]|uniref:GNAT family N-acetyltransferase n=1 Tax=Dokdonella sp. TaxID=2291710 RepID=UPI003263C0A1
MITIRAARTYDAPALADLCAELGYPTTRQQIVKRLAAIDGTADCSVLVAENAEGRVVAWLQVAIAARLSEEPCAEIVGLVVRESARGGGLGKRLIDAAEQWAQARCVKRIRVRSRQERERAHRFYERAGFQTIKNQRVFGKSLT